MVLLGIAFGIFSYMFLTAEEISVLYMDYRFYLLAVLIAFVYNFLFKKVYQDGGYNLDIGTTMLNVLGSSLKLVISSLLMLSFISMFTIV